MTDDRHPSSVIRHRSSVVRHPSSVIRHPSSVIGHPSSVIRHPSSVIRHLSSVSRHLSAVISLDPGSAFVYVLTPSRRRFSMSIHKSLVPASKLRRHRNVLTRGERLEALKKEGRWDEAKSIFGLSKVRNIMTKAKPKKKEAAADATAAGAAPGAPGAAPAAGAAAPAGKAAAPAAGAKAAPAAKKEEKKK